MKYQIERPVNDFPCHTYRNLDLNAPVNQHLDANLGSKISELQEALSEVLIRFDTNPNYYTKEDYFTLIELLRGLLSYLYIDLGTHPFNGVLTDLTVNPLDTINPGVYITSTIGIYENFKDKEGNPIEITYSDTIENIVVLNPKIDENNIWYYEKIKVPVKVNQTNLNCIFKTAENTLVPNGHIIEDVYQVKDGPDPSGMFFNGNDQVILFKINADNKWLYNKASNIKINFFRIANKKRLSLNDDDFGKQKFGIRNSLFTMLNDSGDTYKLENFHIKSQFLRDCKIIKNLDTCEFYNLEDLNTIEGDVWFMLPYSTFKIFRRLFRSDKSFLYSYKNDSSMKLSGNGKTMFWHPRREYYSSSIKLKIGFNISYTDDSGKEYFSDIKPFCIRFKDNRCKLIY